MRCKTGGMVERVELHTLDSGIRVVRERAWMTGHPAGSDCERVEVGRLTAQGRPDRHYAWRTDKGPAYVFAVERPACELADRWLSSGGWRPTPACFGPDGLPADGRAWARQGQDWVPDGPSSDAVAGRSGPRISRN